MEIYSKGFSIIEIMVAAAIFTIVISSTYVVMGSGRAIWSSGDARIELQEDLRHAADVIAYELCSSAPTRVAISSGGSSITFQVPVDENATGTWEDTNLDGRPDFYFANTIYLDPQDNKYKNRWGGYLRQEDRAVASAAVGRGNREKRRVGYVLVVTPRGNELRRRVFSNNGVIMEDFLIEDNIQGLNFALDPNSDSDAVIVTISGTKTTLSRQPVNYSLTTAVHLRNKG